MSPDFSPELRAELLDDFYAESDEHLANIRSQIALLEATLGKAAPEPAVLESVFRSLHSFKGLCAMVGLHGAEQLAHSGEDLLRRLTRNMITLTGDELDVLVAVTQRLEQIVTAHRLHHPMPDAADLLRELHALNASNESAASDSTAPFAPPASSVNDVARRLEALRARGLAPWRCTFSPSRELDQRGININAVRTRLGAIGEIVSAVPSVQPGGSISFEFLLGIHAVPEDLTAWERDGLTLSPFAVAPGVAPKDEASPQETAAGGDQSSSLFIAPSHVVRVELNRLDELMRIAGELVIHRSRLEERIQQLPGDTSPLKEVNQAIARSLRQLRGAITHVRMVPVAEIFTRMPFVVRDLGRETGKKVRLVLEGQQTEIDKYLVERLKEPLLHLVRNAFTHGVESPDERAAAGKPPEATIVLRATAAGEFVAIQIRDDGRGIDSAVIARRAAALGLEVPAPIDEASLLRLLCTPGFSTREEADRAAGRGVGMAVVHNAVRELGGRLSFDTTPGVGTQFTLRLPLTLSIAETIIVSAGDQTCAVPQAYIDEIFQAEAGQVRTINRSEVIPYRDGVLPLVRLGGMFGAAKSERPQISVLVLSSERGSTGLVVDRVHTQREIVVRPMQDPLLQAPGISGATELGDGRPVLILDPIAITNGVVRPHAAVSRANDKSQIPNAKEIPIGK